MSGLTDFQVEVARLFFGLPASEGFLLAGGGALLASGLTDRLTHDLDFFGAPDDVDVTAARDQFEDAVRSWLAIRTPPRQRNLRTAPHHGSRGTDRRARHRLSCGPTAPSSRIGGSIPSPATR